MIDQTLRTISNQLIVTVSSEGELKILNIESSECLKTMHGHTDFIHCIIKLSEKLIASCSRYKTIRIWNLSSGQCLKTIEYPVVIYKLSKTV